MASQVLDNQGTITGKLLRINLSDRKIQPQTIPASITKGYVGGRGLGIRYLYQELKAGTDPLGPDNKLIFTVGPLAGTSAQACSRWFAITKSPLTGGYGRGSGGGDFGAWLKFLGYDFMIIEGKATEPVYLYIEDDIGRLLDAKHLWGKDTQETQEILRNTHGSDCRIACIGPAAEKLVRFAIIASGKRAAARCGLGTVMGSKNLKAIVINAKPHITISSPAQFKELVKEQIKSIQANPACQSMIKEGTTSVVPGLYYLGLIPVKNYRESRLEGMEKISADAYTAIKTGQDGCYSCMIRCGQVHRVESGPYAGATSEGPEYETIWALGANLGNTDIGSTVAADALCDSLGIDTMSTGAAISFAMELYERGLITKDETDGLELTWGNHVAMIEMVKKIANRQGIGDLLAEGTKRAAARIGHGAEAYAMQVKGLEFSAYEPRGAKAQAVSYATSNIGAAHGYGLCRQEVYGVPIPRPVDRFSEEGKGELAAWNQKNKALLELASLCTFIGPVVPPPLLAKLLVAATGISEFGDPQYLDKVSERVITLERVFNVRDGFARKDDTLPERLLREPIMDGSPSANHVVQNLDGMLDEYYKVLGYTSNGIPKRQKLMELGLGFAVEDCKQVTE